MKSPLSRRLLALLVCCAALLAWPAGAQTPAAPATPIGIVVMHGKGGSPNKFVADLAATLQQHGLRVANLEMAWSGRRDYDVPVSQAQAEVEAALQTLRAQGAQKLFVAGHSQGGLFAFHLGGVLALDGVIAIAPGGSVSAPVYREKLGDSLALARQLLAEGKGEEKTRLLDYEGSRGTYPLVTRPSTYLSWFDPAGAMNQANALARLAPATPVLLIVPTQDYPGLLRLKQQTFAALPRHPLTQLYEPDASHLEAPSASAQEIIRWTAAVAAVR